MKTKTFVLLCLLSGIGLTQLSAQNGKNGDGVISFWETGISYPQDVIAEDGTVLDVLDCTLIGHITVHFKNGVIIRVDYNSYGTALAQKTGEEFKMIEIGKKPFSSVDPIIGFDYFHVNLIGNHGTHLLIEATLDYSTWLYTINKISWPGDKYWDGN